MTSRSVSISATPSAYEGWRYRPSGPADTSNWLPAPAAPFRPLMRLYQPQAAVLDGTYKLPPITKVTG